MKKPPMIVRVLNQAAFNNGMRAGGINDSNVEMFHKTVFISIVDSSGMDPYFKYDHKNVLNLKFDDLSDEEFERTRLKGKGFILFDKHHAQRIINFLEQNSDREYCFVHCSAGVSRSGAVGMFINDFYSSVDYFTFMSQNRFVKPNAYILALLKRVYYEGNSGGE